MVIKVTECGKNIDEMGEAINDVEKVLGRFNISLRDSEHEFRDISTVLDEVATKWNTLESVERNQIATAISGTYNRNTFIATMENYSRVQELVRESTNATGIAEKKYEAVLDSVEAKLNQFTATWERLVNNLNQGDTIKGLIDAGTQLISILDVVINKTNLLEIGFILLTSKGVSMVVDGFIKISNGIQSANKIFDLAKKGINMTNEEINAFGKSLQGLPTSIQAVMLKTSGLTDENLKVAMSAANLSNTQQKLMLKNMETALSLSTLTKTTKVLGKEFDLTTGKFIRTKTALGTLNNLAGQVGLGLTTLGTTLSTVGIAFTGIMWYINKHQQDIENLKQAYHDATEEMKSFNSEISSNLAYLNTNQSRFNELSKGVSEYGTNIGLTANEYKEYKQIISEVAKISPALIEGYNAEGEAIMNKNGLLEKSIELLRQERKEKIANAFSIGEYNDTYKGAVEEEKSEKKQQNKNIEAARNNLEASINKIQSEFYKGNSDVDILSYLGFNQASIEERFQAFRYALINNAEDLSKELLNTANQLYNQGKLSVEQYQLLTSGATGYTRAQDIADKKIKEASKDLIELNKQVPLTVDGYEKLSDEAKIVAETFASTFNLENGNASNGEYIKTQIEAFTEALVNGVDGINIDKKIQELFTIDKSILPASLYESKINRELDEILSNIEMSDVQRENLKASLKLSLGVDIVDQNGQTMSSLDAGIKEIIDNLSNITRGQLEGLSQQEFEMAVKIAPKLDPNSSFQDLLDAIKNKMNEVSYEIANFSQIGSQFADSVSNTFSNINILNTALDEFNTYGYLAAGTFKSISDNNLLEYLDFTSNGLQVNTQALLNNAEAARQKSLEDLNIAYTESVVALANQTLAMSDDDLAQAEVRTAQTTVGLAKDLANLGNTAISTANIVSMAVTAMDSQIQQMSNRQREYFNTELNKLTAQFNSVRNAMINTTNSVQTTTKYIGGLGQSTKDLEKASEGSAKAAKDQADALKDLKKEISDLISQLNKAQGNVDDLVQMTIKMLRQQYEEQKKILEEQLEKLTEKYEKEQEYIEKETEEYKKKLDLEREFLKEKEKEYQYQKDLESKRKDVTDIQNQLDTLQFDDSIEGQKKRLELAQELADKEAELDDFQHDHEIEVIEDALDKEEKRFDELQEKKLEALEEEYNKQKELLDKRISDIEEYVSKEFNLWNNKSFPLYSNIY